MENEDKEDSMTFYEYLHRVAEIVAPTCGEELFDYIIHSMDNDGGFLRSRWCRWDDTLKEMKGDFGGQITTSLKMQVFYYDVSDKGDFDDSAQWSADLGYPIALMIDMENGTYESAEYEQRC